MHIAQLDNGASHTVRRRHQNGIELIPLSEPTHGFGRPDIVDLTRRPAYAVANELSQVLYKAGIALTSSRSTRVTYQTGI